METELRRCRSNLSILGSGVIVFTVWELIRPILISLLVQKTSDAAPADVSVPELPLELVVLLIAAILALAVLDLLLRFHIGRSARAEAAGKRKGNAYVVFAFLIFGFQAIGLLVTVIQLFRAGLMESSILDTAASLLVELGSTVIMGELAFTAVKVKKLSKPDIG